MPSTWPFHSENESQKQQFFEKQQFPGSVDSVYLESLFRLQCVLQVYALRTAAGADLASSAPQRLQPAGCALSSRGAGCVTLPACGRSKSCLGTCFSALFHVAGGLRSLTCNEHVVLPAAQIVANKNMRAAASQHEAASYPPTLLRIISSSSFLFPSPQPFFQTGPFRRSPS